MAQPLTVTANDFMENIFGLSAQADQVLVQPWLLAVAAAVGVATSMIAAFLPARNAARVDPVKALQKGQYQVLSAGENRRRRTSALAAIAIAVACIVFGRCAISPPWHDFEQCRV